MKLSTLIKTGVGLVALAVVAVVHSPSAYAAVDDCTWLGTTSSNMNTASNWSCATDGAAVPGAGDTLIFPAVATTKAVNNDIAGGSFAYLTFADGYTVSGNAFTITGKNIGSLDRYILFSAGGNTLSTDVTIDGSTNSYINNSGNNTISGSLTASGTPSLYLSINSNNSELTLSGSLNGYTRDISIQSSGIPSPMTSSRKVKITNANTSFANSVSVANYAHLVVTNKDGLGTNAGHTSVYDTGILTFDIATDETITEPLYLNGYGIEGALYFNGTSTYTMTGNIVLDSDTMVTIPTDASVMLNGVVSGTGGVLFASNGNGDFTLSGNNTYSGGSIIMDTAATARHANAFGTGVIEIDTSYDSLLVLNPSANYTIDNPILINGTGASTTRSIIGVSTFASSLTGPITLDADAEFSIYQNGNINLNGPISGSGQLALYQNSGTGIFMMEGTAVNTYSGGTVVDGGSLWLAKTGAGVSIPGNVTVSANASLGGNAELGLGVGVSSTQVADNAMVTLTNDGLFTARLESHQPNEVVGGVGGNGTISGDNVGDEGITVGGGNVSSAFTGVFEDLTNDITKIGSGTWDLSGASQSTTGGGVPANIFVNGGTVKVGSNLNTIDITINSGGKLMGTGTLKDVVATSGGTIAVGNSPGCLTFASLTLNSGAIWDQDITSATACSGYDQSTVSGTVSLGGATLQVNQLASLSLPVGTILTIIDSSSVTGTFAGLVDGAVFQVGTLKYRINYTSNGDVTLTVVPSATATTSSTPSTALAETGESVVWLAAVAVGTILASIVVLITTHRSSVKVIDS